LFKERKTKFALLSILSALVVVSTAFAGVSIYAQTDDSELTTFEEEAITAGEEFEDTMNATSADNATDDDSTSTADLSFLEGLVVCDVGTAEISNETEVAALDNSSLTTPTVSVEVMTETEVAELAANETETASETSVASASCVLTGGDDTSTSGNATDADDATPASNATGTANATDGAMPELGSNATSTASTPGSGDEILVVEGQDFAPGQVVLMFSEDALVGIDDVDDNGEIEAKIPAPDSGDTAIAGNDTAGTELRFVESGTQRTATFEFDGETLTASEGGDIEAADSGDAMTMPAPAPGNTTSTNGTSTNSTSNATMQ
jgi:hypothetical protein